MQKKIFILFVLSVYSMPGQVKKYKDQYEKKTEVLETARRYNYPKFFAQKAELNYDFDVYGYSDPPDLEVNETVKLKLISAQNNTVYKDAIFYDDNSSIKYVNVKNETGREIPTSIIYGNYQNENVFHDDLKLGVYEVSMPSIGTERNIEYQKKFKDYKYLSKIYLVNDYPSEETVVRIQVPDWLTIEIQRFNFEKFHIEEKTEKKKSKDGKTNFTEYSFSVKNTDKFSNEKNSPSYESIYPHIILLFKSFRHEGKDYDLLKDIQGLYNWCNGLCKKVECDTSKLIKTVNELLKGKTTNEEKIESIFYWVQDKIRYVAFEEGIMGYKPMAADKVYSMLYGDCKGMANLLKNMLKLAGFDARLTWIGTRDIPYKELYPTLGIFNHMICCVIVDGKKYFIDGTEDFVALGDYAHRIQGKTVMIEDGDNFITDKIPEFNYERNKEESFIDLKVIDGKLKGTKKSLYNGEEKLSLLNGYSVIKSENRETALKNYLTFSDKNVRISNIAHSDLNERKKPVEISFDLEVDNFVFSSGKDLYIYDDFEKNFEKYTFDSTRTTDWEIDHKIFYTTTTWLEVPAGYKVKSMPGNFDIDNDDYKIHLNFKSEGNKVIYAKTYIFKNAVIRKNDFNKWNKISEQMRKVYNTPVILTHQ